MSYDIDLKDPVTNEVIELPVKHLMIGGTYRADYDEATGTFSPMPINEAHLNITYNYSGYYYDATEGDNRFFGKRPDFEDGNEPRNLGIRGIYGKTGAESIPMLNDMIQRITEKYQKDGEWITTARNEIRWLDKNGNEAHPAEVLGSILQKNGVEYTKEEYVEEVNEDVNSDYWKATAGNAIRPLHQLISMAQLRPDGIWDGD